MNKDLFFKQKSNFLTSSSQQWKLQNFQIVFGHFSLPLLNANFPVLPGRPSIFTASFPVFDGKSCRTFVCVMYPVNRSIYCDSRVGDKAMSMQFRVGGLVSQRKSFVQLYLGKIEI